MQVPLILKGLPLKSYKHLFNVIYCLAAESELHFALTVKSNRPNEYTIEGIPPYLVYKKAYLVHENYGNIQKNVPRKFISIV